MVGVEAGGATCRLCLCKTFAFSEILEITSDKTGALNQNIKKLFDFEVSHLVNSNNC